jgi:uncharacterized protein YdgA (DUF945 family)
MARRAVSRRVSSTIPSLNFMKKQVQVGAGLVVLAAVYVGATAYTGNKVVTAYGSAFDQVHDRFPCVRFDRKVEKRFFSSTFTTDVQVLCALPGTKGEKDEKGDGKESTPLTFQLIDQVRHGPFPGLSFGAAAIDSRIALPDSAPEDLRAYLASMKPGDLRTHVSYGGGYRTSLRLPAGEVRTERGSFTWSEARANAEGRLGEMTGTVEGDWSGMTFQAQQEGNDTTVKIADVHLRGQTRSDGGNGSLWFHPGNSELRIGQLDVQSQAKGQPLSVRVSGINYTSEQSNDKELLNAVIAVKADASVQLGAETKPLELEKIEFRETIKRLHLPSLQKWFEAIAELGSNGNVSQEVEQFGRSRKNLDMLVQLLPHDPEVAVHWSMNHQGQHGELSYLVGTRDFTLKDGEPIEMLQARVIPSLIVQANAKLPFAWIEEVMALGSTPEEASQRILGARMMVEMGVQQGVVVREGADATVAFSFERGAATLNGKPFRGLPIPQVK